MYANGSIQCPYCEGNETVYTTFRKTGELWTCQDCDYDFFVPDFPNTFTAAVAPDPLLSMIKVQLPPVSNSRG